jgi:hypothetical protein
VTRDPALYLEDMLVHARAAHRFVEGMTLDAFAGDVRTQYAVKYALHIVGKARFSDHSARSPVNCNRPPVYDEVKIISVRQGATGCNQTAISKISQ